MKFLVIALSTLVISGLANAGTTCRTDWKGDYVCTHSSGYSTTTTRDWKGDDVTTDSYGNTMTCSYDWKGDYVCN